MRVQIIPLRRMPSNLAFLDYLPGNFENQIAPGQLVTIPIRNKCEYGIVRKVMEFSDIDESKLKPITSIIHIEPLLPPSLIEFYVEMSEFYRTPLGFVVKSAILPLKKNKLTKIGLKLFAFPALSPVAIEKPVLFSYRDIESRNIAVIKLAESKGQTLIIVPELGAIDPLFDILSAKCSSAPVTISGEMGDKDYFDLWLKIRSDANAVIIGTRKALFLPFTNLKNIIVEDEGSQDHKSWDMAPRFHTRDAALMLMKHTGARLYLMSAAPSVESYFFAHEGIYDGAGKTEKISFPNPIFIDAAREKQSSKGGYIASEIVQSIRDAKGDSFILTSRRGTSNAVICRDCGRVFRCALCRRPLTYFETDNKLHCVFCHDSRPLHSTCPGCAGPSYRMVSPGALGIASELKTLLPGKRIITVDKDDPLSVKELNFPGSKIIVGTKFAWSVLNWPRIEVMVITDPDSVLALPEFRAAEFLWQDIRRAQFKLADTASLYIQTSETEHHVFQGLYNPAIFYETELAERRAFGYPPHQYITRLIYAGNQGAADREANRLAKALTSLTQPMGDVRINGPFPATPQYYRGKSWRIIVVKFNYKNYKQRAKEILKNVSDDWKVDPNPNNLMTIA